ncbi:hypothetical protein FD755_014687 [Muntiacus reevesi]|uniref:Uncharacterized protein n=1 Tax=Muntiacus reevesi TaxID=9886 RepID=A0A5N3XKQ3_MUNRE|nr:hypothetical protein FD755_014687 [Muntiacus reevesi]
MQNGQEDCPLRRGGLAPNFPWAISSRQDNDGISGNGDDMEISIEENCLPILMGEVSNHQDHHDKLCL